MNIAKCCHSTNFKSRRYSDVANSTKKSRGKMFETLLVSDGDETLVIAVGSCWLIPETVMRASDKGENSSKN